MQTIQRTVKILKVSTSLTSEVVLAQQTRGFKVSLIRWSDFAMAVLEADTLLEAEAHFAAAVAMQDLV